MTHNVRRGQDQRHGSWHKEYGTDGRVVSYTAPQAGVWGPWTRPPLGPPLAGRRATMAGRGNRECQSEAAKAWRWQMAYRAWRLRIERAATTRQIAAQLGIPQQTAARWLYGCPALRLPAEPGEPPLDDLLAALPPRPPRAARTLSPRLDWQTRALRDMRR